MTKQVSNIGRQVSVKTFGHGLARLANSHRRVAIKGGAKQGFWVDVTFTERGHRYFIVCLDGVQQKCEPASQDAAVLRATADALVAKLCDAAGVGATELEQGEPGKVGMGASGGAPLAFSELNLTPVKRSK